MSPAHSTRLLRAALGEPGPADPTFADWSDWAEFAIGERLIPLLHRVVETMPTEGAAALTDDQRRSIETMQLDVMGTMVRFEHDLLEIAEAFGSVGTGFAVLKGAATAHLDYADPSLRQFADVDLLVAPSDLERAIAVLADLGWSQAYALPRHHERFTHAVTLRNGGRVEVDLHQRIAHRALGLLADTEQLLAETVEFDLAGTQLRALASGDRLINAAIHALSSRPPYRRLSATADVLVLASASSCDAGAVLERAESWRLRRLVERSVVDAFVAAELPVPDRWQAASELPHRRRPGLVDRAYLAPRRRPAAEELAHLRLMRGWGERREYLRGYFATDDDYAAANRRRGVAAQTRYLWSRLRSGREDEDPPASVRRAGGALARAWQRVRTPDGVNAVRRRASMAIDRAWARLAARLRPPSAVPFDEDDPRLALITVNFSTTRWLKLMLLTLCEQDGLDLVSDVVIVDNASRDGGPSFLQQLDASVDRVHLVSRRHRLHHGPAMRAGVRRLDRLDEGSRANVLLFCDPDVVFRAPSALRVVAESFLLGDVGLVGEARRADGPSPEIQASFIAVRRDVHARPDTHPMVHDGAPSRRLQESVVAQGLDVIDIPSNAGGLILHRGRSGVRAAAEHRPWHQYATATADAHFMGVADGPEIWSEIEARHEHLLAPDAEDELIAHLATVLDARPRSARPGDR